MEPGEVKGWIITTLQLSVPPLGEHHPPASQLVQLVFLFLSQLEPATHVREEVWPCSTHNMTEHVMEEAGPCSTHVMETSYTPVKKKEGSCSTEERPCCQETGYSHILQDSLKEMIQVALTNFQTDQKRSEPAVVYSLSIPWSSLTRLYDAPSSLLAALHHFSSTLTMLLSVLLKVPGSNSALLIHTFQEVWRSHIQKELLDVGSDMGVWSHCLATMGVCLVVSEVGAVLAKLTVGEVNGVWLQAGQFAGLDNQFPTLLYHEYKKWECLEEASGNGELVATDGNSGLILKVIGLG